MTTPGHRGIIAPLVTPLDTAGAVCRSSVTRQVEALRGAVDAFMPALSTGEGWLLDESQWNAVVRYTIDATEAVVERGRMAADLGATAIAVTSPFGADVGQDQILRHYETVVDATDVDIFVYNESAISGNETTVRTLLEICRLPRVVGVKESSGSVETTRQLIDAQTGVPVFVGWENLLLASAPADGFIGPLALREPALCRAALDRPSDQAQARVDEAVDRYKLLDEQWYRMVKQELYRRGVISTGAVIVEGGRAS